MAPSKPSLQKSTSNGAPSSWNANTPMLVTSSMAIITYSVRICRHGILELLRRVSMIYEVDLGKG